MSAVSTSVLDLDVYSLAKVPRQHTELLPDKGGLYLALDGAQRVWYVGQATSLRERLATHEKEPYFVECGVQFFAWQEAEECDGRNDLERRYIEHFAPPLNQLLVPKAKPCLNLGLSPEEELTRFVELRRQAAEIEFELNMLKANIVTRCEEQGGTIKLRDFQVYLSSRKSWEFSGAVENLEQELKKMRSNEQADGTAKVKSTTVFPVVRTVAKGTIG